VILQLQSVWDATDNMMQVSTGALQFNPYDRHEVSDVSSVRIAKQAGVSAAELKEGGSSAPELKAGGYSAAELKAGGYSEEEAEVAGYSREDLAEAMLVEGYASDLASNFLVGPFVLDNDVLVYRVEGCHQEGRGTGRLPVVRLARKLYKRASAARELSDQVCGLSATPISKRRHQAAWYNLQ
jgi:hypothetical protein